MSFKGRRHGMEVELALKKTTACTTHFSGGSTTCANQPCTVQKADFLWVNSVPPQCYYVLHYFLRATVLRHSLNAQAFQPALTWEAHT
jgi:hypothetical protein